MHFENELRCEAVPRRYSFLNPPQGFEVVECLDRGRFRAEIAFAERVRKVIQVFAREERFDDEQLVGIGREAIDAHGRRCLKARNRMRDCEPRFRMRELLVDEQQFALGLKCVGGSFPRQEKLLAFQHFRSEHGNPSQNPHVSCLLQ